MATIGPSLKRLLGGRTGVGSLVPAALVVVWLALTFLAVNGRYGTVAAQTQPAQAPQTQPAQAAPDPPLPDGPGKDLVLRSCVKCHNLKIVTNKRASEEDWTKSVDNMVNRGAVLTDDEEDEVIDYLSKNFKPTDPDHKPQQANPPQN